MKYIFNLLSLVGLGAIVWAIYYYLGAQISFIIFITFFILIQTAMNFNINRSIKQLDGKIDLIIGSIQKGK